VWPLFLAIGVGFLLLLAFGWGMATGVKLGKNAQARDHEALRAAAQQALAAHALEREAWRAERASAQPMDAAEIAHDRTRRAFLALGVAWGEHGQPDEAPKSPAFRDE
jgi:hypothetical protein